MAHLVSYYNQIAPNLRRTASKGLISLLNQKQLEELAFKHFSCVNTETGQIGYQCPYTGIEFYNYDAIILRSNDEKNFSLDEIHLVPYLDTIKEFKKIYRVLPHKQHIFKKSNINKELYRNLCDKLLRKYNIKNDEKEFAFAYFNYGVLAIIDKWVESDCEEDVYKIADLIIKLISL